MCIKRDGLPHAGIILAVACIAQLIVILDASVVNVALPEIRRDLGLGDTASAWVVTGYAVGFAGVLLVAARSVDIVGVGRILVAGTAVFTLASVAAGIATGPEMLLGARVVQGLAAAVVSPATFTMITLAFPEGRARTRAITVWTAVSVAGGGAGTVLGGLLTGAWSWRLVFLINIPVGLVVLGGLALLVRVVPLWRGSSAAARIDVLSAVCSAVMIGGVVYLLTDIPSLTPGGVSTGIASVLAAVVLLRRQAISNDPLIPVDLLRRRPVALGNVATFLSACCLQSAIWYVLTFRIQDDLAYSPTETGLLFLPLTLSMTATNLLLVPPLVEGIGNRLTVLAGTSVAVGGLVWLAMAPEAVVWPTLLVGAGGGLVGAPLAYIVTEDVPPGQQGAASGMMNTSKQFGGAVGVAGSALTSAPGAFLLMAAAMATAAALTLASRPGRDLTTAAADPRPH
ncbi:MAG: MFS transporter [Mycobacteriaceae bacterium]|uniref:MFS transporter n=1 Tax=Corynebacterium sp. TaxID=1720 RepID=UPI003F9CF05C